MLGQLDETFAHVHLLHGQRGDFLRSGRRFLGHGADARHRFRQHLLRLVELIREQAGSAYLLANRGFGLLPRLADLVDGILFESFSVRWVDGGYAPWPPEVLDHHAEIAEQLHAYDLDLYALDYADNEGLAAFAARRAAEFNLHLFVSDRALSRV